MIEDWGIFFNPDEFGKTALWTVEGGSTHVMIGIFEAAREVALSGDVSVSAILPVFTVSEVQIPGSASQSDLLEIDGTVFSVADIQPSGAGLSLIILERN